MIQQLLGMFMISLVVHSKRILTRTSFITNEAIVARVVDVSGLYVLRDVTLYSGAVGTLTAAPHCRPLPCLSVHLGLDEAQKL